MGEGREGDRNRDLGAPCRDGLSPTVEPASSLAGSATSIPSASDSLPARQFYESVSGGWADGRLGQAYDLIGSVRRDYPRGSVVFIALNDLLDSVESADDEIKDAQP